MEDNKIDNLLLLLEDEIERKCFRIRERKKEEMKGRLFLLACLFFLFLPFMLHYLGVSLLTICLPLIGFLAVSMITLSPVFVANMEVE